MGVAIKSFSTIAGLVLTYVFLAQMALADATIEQFEGDYAGSAVVETYDGTKAKRDMSVSIKETRKGFTLQWTSITYRNEKAKEKTYSIEFVPSERPGVFAAGMARNVFGHAVPLDPMKGEPYVWARIKDKTLTVYSLFVNADGSYELQKYDRTLVEEGLQLEFKRLDEGTPLRSISALLKRQ